MEWRDEGILLSVNRHGESAAVIRVFTHSRGCCAGVVRGGAGRRLGPVLQPGAQLDVVWRARLEEHLGHFSVELIRSRAVAAMSEPLMLAGLNAVTGMLAYCLAERDADDILYENTYKLLDLMYYPDVWPLAYLHWEKTLLQQMGYALMLSECVVTGRRENLVYVSPKSGCAVSREAAGVWADRLLPLPDALSGVGQGDDVQVLQGLKTTGYFLEKHLANALARPLPDARARFIDVLARRL